MQNSKGLRHSKMRQNEKNGARTLFFLVYVSFTLIIIHNQWNSGLIYRFSFFRSSFFRQRLCFLVVTAFEITRTGTHTPMYILLHHIFIPFTNANCYVTANFTTHHHGHHHRQRANSCVCHCAKMQIFWCAAPSPLRCTVQLSSRPSSSKCMYFVNSYFFRFSILNPYSYVEEMVVVDVILFVCLFGWFGLLAFRFALLLLAFSVAWYYVLYISSMESKFSSLTVR